jgi:hypothetical protein
MADAEVEDVEPDEHVQQALSGWARIVNKGAPPSDGQVVTTGDPSSPLDWQYRRGRWRRIVQGRL